MCEAQTGETGVGYVYERRSIQDIGQHNPSTDCGYFSGYAMKAYKDANRNIGQARMSREEVYLARNAYNPRYTTLDHGSDPHGGLARGRAVGYLASLGITGYQSHSVGGELAVEDRHGQPAFRRIIGEALERHGHYGVMLPYGEGIQPGHWIVILQRHRNMWLCYDPSDPEGQGHIKPIFPESDRATHFFANTAIMSIICAGPNPVYPGGDADLDRDPVDVDEGDGDADAD